MVSWEALVGSGGVEDEVVVRLHVDRSCALLDMEGGRGSVVGEGVGAGEGETEMSEEGAQSEELQGVLEDCKYTETVSLLTLVLTASPLSVPGLVDGFLPEGGGVVGARRETGVGVPMAERTAAAVAGNSVASLSKKEHSKR